mgnify:CR=1 FL=1
MAATTTSVRLEESPEARTETQYALSDAALVEHVAEYRATVTIAKQDLKLAEAELEKRLRERSGRIIETLEYRATLVEKAKLEYDQGTLVGLQEFLEYEELLAMLTANLTASLRSELIELYGERARQIISDARRDGEIRTTIKIKKRTGR